MADGNMLGSSHMTEGEHLRDEGRKFISLDNLVNGLLDVQRNYQNYIRYKRLQGTVRRDLVGLPMGDGRHQ
ncbi:hypothetical protein RvY_02685 [Ramazzottius varieornatus]|uniref:Uncharacterized protein n=1 Tax=Ramazzottius varieornatus TaxID=947166 RepID=A0A1D1USN1_RAMVA|nr:hypothetical protein RvY_02685 [Ramazzottius varieornatus]